MNDPVKMLGGLKILNFGVGMAPALVGKLLSEMGADVYRIRPERGDPFEGIYPAYELWRSLEKDIVGSGLDELWAEADACIIGGEDYPGLARSWDAGDIEARHPRIVVLDIAGYPAGTSSFGQPATELLVQARSGLTWEQFTTRPIPMSFAPSSYGAALRGTAGLLAALYDRERTGRGQSVHCSLFAGALSWVTSLWSDIERPTPAANFVMPKDPHPLVLRCSDGVFIHLVIGAPGSKYRMYQALGIDDPTVRPEDSSMPKAGTDPRNFFGDIDLLSEHAAKWDSKTLLQRIWDLGLPAEPVLPPGDVWDSEQVQHNGIISTAADGRRYVGLPFAFVPHQGNGITNEPAGGRAPLSGVRIADFGAYIAGPFTATILGDLGANVVKVEPTRGDPNRSVFRSFSSANRGKRSIGLDLKDPADLMTARNLAIRSDIVMSNFRPGVSDRLGIGATSLHAEKPGLVILESPAYGSSGPLAARAGFDLVMQALCGHELRAGGVGNPPLWNRTYMVDYANGMLAAVGCVAALLHRARTGNGATLSAPLLNAGIYLLSELVRHPDGRIEGAEPLNSAQTGYGAAESLYELRDGWIAIAIRGAKAAKSAAGVLGLDGRLSADPTAWDDPERELIAAAIADRTTAEAIDMLRSAGLWVEECRQDVDREVLSDPAYAAAGFVQVATHPEFGELRELSTMMRFSRSEAGHSVAAPLVAQHSAEIRAEIDADRVGTPQGATAELH